MPHSPVSFGDFGNFAVFLILVLMGIFAVFAFLSSFTGKNNVREGFHRWIAKWKLAGKKDDPIIRE